jgi:hypothetical protein
MSDDFPHCPYCANADASCRHLLLIIEEQSPLDAGGGVLNDEVEAISEAFRAIYEEVARRDAVCGTGILLQATKAFFLGWGYIAGTEEIHAELRRHFGAEYLVDLLDLVPNLQRKKFGTAPEIFECVWGESPGPARLVIAERLRELGRLASLPDGAPEWIHIEPV